MGPARQVMGFWSRLTAGQRGEMLRVGTRVRFGADGTILRQGDRNRHLVVILTGSAKVVRNPGNGPEKILALCAPGTLIGELAALTGAPRSAEVRALEPVGALIVSDVEFAGAARADPGLHDQLALALAEQLLLANQLLTDTAVPAALPRLAAVLASLGEQFAPKGTGPVVLPVSQTELASLAATSEASVARALRTLRGMSLVRTGRRRVVLTDPGALRSYADTVS